MFGYASAFVNENMFAGTFQNSIVVRLAETDRVALLKLKGAAPFEPMSAVTATPSPCRRRAARSR